MGVDYRLARSWMATTLTFIKGESKMKKHLLDTLSLALITLLGLAAVPAHAAKIRVVTTLTDLADFSRNVGGDHVEVFSLATGIEDTHGVPMKPSFVPEMNRANLLMLVGFGCEHAFLPALLEASKNPRIQYGQPGYVDCSKGVVPMEVPKTTDHSAGDVHPYGNPHYNLDPVWAKTAVENIYKALASFAPEYREDFTRNRDAYLSKLDAKIAEWKETLLPAKGEKFVSYHEHWAYFAKRFGLNYFGTIELKPGIDPTPRYIENLVTSMKVERVPLVVREPQFPEKVPALIARQTGAKLVKLPIMPGGVPNTETYIKMMDYIVHTMADTAKERPLASR
jgi:zinc/manganese transport system substrate-binding protein